MHKQHFLSFYFNIFVSLKPVFKNLIANLLKKSLLQISFTVGNIKHYNDLEMNFICLYVRIQKSGQKTLNPTSVECLASKQNWEAKKDYSDQLDGAFSFRELLSQTKVMQIRQRETLSHQRAILREVCLSSAQYSLKYFFLVRCVSH